MLVEVGKYELFQAQSADFRVFGLQTVLELLHVHALRAIYEGVRARLMVVRDVQKDAQAIESLHVLHSLGGGLVLMSSIFGEHQCFPLDLVVEAHLVAKCDETQPLSEFAIEYILQDLEQLSQDELITLEYFQVNNERLAVRQVLGNGREAFSNELLLSFQEKGERLVSGYYVVSDRESWPYGADRLVHFEKRYSLYQNRVKDRLLVVYQADPQSAIEEQVFFSLRDAYMCLRFFYRQNETHDRSRFYQTYIDNKLRVIHREYSQYRVMSAIQHLLCYSIAQTNEEFRWVIIVDCLKVLVNDHVLLLRASNQYRKLLRMRRTILQNENLCRQAQSLLESVNESVLGTLDRAHDERELRQL